MPLKRVSEQTYFRPEKLNKVNLFENARFFCDLYCLEAGQEQKVHAHEAEDKVYYVLSGEVVFRDGSEDVPATAGDALWARAGEEHGVRNPGRTRATLLVFMAPHPRAAEFGSA
ncbi:MAG: cupin domain-containing protein [Candidatus Sumerlaeaceae bacterium]